MSENNSHAEVIAKLSEEQSIHESKGLPSRTGPLFQYDARCKLELEEQNYNNGDRLALFAAIRICAAHELVFPDWLARSFISGYDQVLNCRSKSWDDAFGKPYPGKHVDKLKTKRDKRYSVYNRVKDLTNPHKAGNPMPIDDGLFEQVGEEFGIGKTLCKELYYSVVK